MIPSADPVEILFRPARLEDLPGVVAMLADDLLGREREDPSVPLNPRYVEAFAAISANPSQHLVVAEHDGQVVGTLQLSFLAGLARKGASRALVEGVRVRGDRRDLGLGTRLIAWAVEAARRNGCGSVELVTHKSRSGAHRFYQRLGFKPTHLGFKLEL